MTLMEAQLSKDRSSADGTAQPCTAMQSLDPSPCAGPGLRAAVEFLAWLAACGYWLCYSDTLASSCAMQCHATRPDVEASDFEATLRGNMAGTRTRVKSFKRFHPTKSYLSTMVEVSLQVSLDAFAGLMWHPL